MPPKPDKEIIKRLEWIVEKTGKFKNDVSDEFKKIVGENELIQELDDWEDKYSEAVEIMIDKIARSDYMDKYGSTKENAYNVVITEITAPKKVTKKATGEEFVISPQAYGIGAIQGDVNKQIVEMNFFDRIHLMKDLRRGQMYTVFGTVLNKKNNFMEKFISIGVNSVEPTGDEVPIKELKKHIKDVELDITTIEDAGATPSISPDDVKLVKGRVIEVFTGSNKVSPRYVIRDTSSLSEDGHSFMTVWVNPSMLRYPKDSTVKFVGSINEGTEMEDGTMRPPSMNAVTLIPVIAKELPVKTDLGSFGKNTGGLSEDFKKFQKPNKEAPQEKEEEKEEDKEEKATEEDKGENEKKDEFNWGK